VVDAANDVYDTTEESTVFSGKGWAPFVMAPDDTLNASSHKDWNHWRPFRLHWFRFTEWFFD